MQNKLQEITDKLYQEGLSKGKADAEQELQQARKEAENILSDARQQARLTIEQAQKQAQDILSKAESDVKKAGKAIISEVKHQIETVVAAKIIGPSLHSALEQSEFIKSLLSESVKNFRQTQTGDLALLLPEKMQKELDAFVKENIGSELQKGLEIRFSGSFASGFKILNKEQAYFVSFTEEDFMTLFKEYLKPKLQEVLF